jgi:glycosyltransferase involved in cell wall biosynthesis
MKSISVIIPAYNEEKNIGLCLASLIPQARDAKAEIILVNDGSKDHTIDIAKLFSKYVKIVSLRKNSGVANARNAGARVARGNILAFIDADCVANPGWLKTIQKNMNGKIGLMGPIKSLFYERLIDHTTFETFSNLVKITVYVKPFVAGSNFACRKKYFTKVGGFKLLKSLEDFDLGFRLSTHGKIRFSDKMIVYSSVRRMKASKLENLNYIINYLRLLTRQPTKKLKNIR